MHGAQTACQRLYVEASWNVMAQAQKPDFVFRQNGRVHLNRRGRQFSRLLAAEVCVSTVVMLDTPCSEVVWWILAAHSIRQFPHHFPARASRCTIRFQLDSTTSLNIQKFCVLPTIHLCFAWISEQRAIISLYNINLSVFITEAESVLLRGTNWIFESDWYRFVLKGLILGFVRISVRNIRRVSRTYNILKSRNL
jgi:hypothetical protein